jgi:hypothetical protein
LREKGRGREEGRRRRRGRRGKTKKASGELDGDSIQVWDLPLLRNTTTPKTCTGSYMYTPNAYWSSIRSLNANLKAVGLH